MKQPTKASAKDLFDGREHYVIPTYQRPYVWNEEDQWAPLWQDILSVAESHLDGSETPLTAHFLGAAVFESGESTIGGVSVHQVIDGQQRLTTMQLLLDAVQEVVAGRGHAEDADDLDILIANGSPRFTGTKERFKLWPSKANRAEFVQAMDPDGPTPAGVGATPANQGPIGTGHAFFKAEAERWLAGEPDENGDLPPGTEADRARELVNTLRDRLVVVAIDLTKDDDAQLIFETLNDRGTPLLRADLIKNWVFRRGEDLGADVDLWAETIWDDFDTDWWRDEISQGRLYRSRVDIFLQYWLTMRRREEVRQDRVFDVFKDYAAPHMASITDAESFLLELRTDADTYRGLGALSEETPEGHFRSRVIEAMELAATTPIFLYVISQNHHLPTAQVEVGLSALESWAVRRTLLRMTTKDMNKFVVVLLKALDGVAPSETGDAIKVFLSQQTADARRWPTDAELVRDLPSRRMYGQIKQSRIAVVLRAVEEHKRSLNPKFGVAALDGAWTLEHVMPQKWREHWRSTPELTDDEKADRDYAIHTLGNLTLVTQALNSSLSNRPWTDAEAAGLKAGGQAGQGKWRVLSQYNLIVLNKEILDAHSDAWTEQDIKDRGTNLARDIVAVWPGPDQAAYDAALASSQ